MRPLLHFLQRRSEDVMVGLMVIMFTSFIIQIATRYVFNAPTEWTYEVILITWLWAVFWGAAFLLEDKDHVKFDIIYNMGGEKTRRRLALLSAEILVCAFALSLPATYDFISFKSIRSSDTLGIRLDILFSVYLIFLVAMIIHYGLRAYRLMRGDSMANLEREESL
jgi:TRAP-type C4-dicarboxylate transport system permease small subunit